MLTRIDNLSKHGWKLLYMFYLWNVNCKEKTKKQRKNMVSKVECIYYLDGVWRVCVWVSGGEANLPSWAPSDMEERFKWNEGYCLRYVCVIKKNPSHRTGWIHEYVTTNNSVICLCFVFVLFPGGHCVALLPPSHCICLLNWNCMLCNDYCKWKMSFQKNAWGLSIFGM